MTFPWPGLLVLLALVAVLVAAYVIAPRRRRPAGVRYSSVSLIRDAVPPHSRWRRHLPFALFAAAVACSSSPSPGPPSRWRCRRTRRRSSCRSTCSGSMCSSDIPPNRLLAAEAAAAAFVEAQGASTQIGIVAFSGFAEMVQAPTSDRQLLLDALHSLMTGRRTAIGSGILDAIDAISTVDPASRAA